MTTPGRPGSRIQVPWRPPLRIATLQLPIGRECTFTGPDLTHSHRAEVLKDLAPFDLPARVCLADLVLSDDE